MIHQINFISVFLLNFGTFYIREALCYPAATPDDFLSLGLNYFTKTAKSVSPKFGFNRLLSPFSDLQSRIHNVQSTEQNNIYIFQKSLHPWQISRYNTERSKDNYDKQYRSNEELVNTQQNTFTENHIGILSPTTPNNVSENKNRTTEPSISYDANKAMNDNDINNGNEILISSEVTTEFTTESTEFTTEWDELSDRIGVPPNVVASLLG